MIYILYYGNIFIINFTCNVLVHIKFSPSLQSTSVFSNKTIIIINNNRLQRCTNSRIAVKTLRTEFQHSGRLSDDEFRNCKPEKK